MRAQPVVAADRLRRPLNSDVRWHDDNIRVAAFDALETSRVGI